eukprot:UN04293
MSNPTYMLKNLSLSFKTRKDHISDQEFKVKIRSVLKLGRPPQKKLLRPKQFYTHF